MAAKKETKREKFVRMAEARTIKIISMVRLLGNCSNRLAYEYSEKDVNKIFNAIESAVADATGFSFPSGHTQNVFATFGGVFAWTKKTCATPKRSSDGWIGNPGGNSCRQRSPQRCFS